MVKNKKNGINLMALICIVFVLLILAGTLVVSFNNVFISTKEKEFANEIYSIQKLVDQYYFKNAEYPVKGEDISFVEQFTNTPVTGKELDLYEADVNEAKRGKRSNSDEEDIYIVSETGVVYYMKGEKIGKNVYYTLTDDLKKQLGLVK